MALKDMDGKRSGRPVGSKTAHPRKRAASDMDWVWLNMNKDPEDPDVLRRCRKRKGALELLKFVQASERNRHFFVRQVLAGVKEKERGQVKNPVVDEPDEKDEGLLLLVDELLESHERQSKRLESVGLPK